MSSLVSPSLPPMASMVAESSATPSLPPKPPDPDLDVVFPVDPPEPPVPPDPPPILLVFFKPSSNLWIFGFLRVFPTPDSILGFTNLDKSLVFGLISLFSGQKSLVPFCLWPSFVVLLKSSEIVALGQLVLSQIDSTFMASCDFIIALVRPSTAVCSFRSVVAFTVIALMLSPSYLWQIEKKNDITCFSIMIRICWGFHSLVYSFMAIILLSFLSLGLSDGLLGSITSNEVLCLFSSMMDLFLDVQDLPVLQGFSSRLYDLIAIVAKCLTLLIVQVAVTFMGISKLVYKLGCQELIHLLL